MTHSVTHPVDNTGAESNPKPSHKNGKTYDWTTCPECLLPRCIKALVLRMFGLQRHKFQRANIDEAQDALTEAYLCWCKVLPNLKPLDNADGQRQAIRYFAKSFVRVVSARVERRIRKGLVSDNTAAWDDSVIERVASERLSPETEAEIRIAARHMDALCANDPSSPEAMDAVLRFAGDSAREAARLTGLSVSKYQRHIRGRRSGDAENRHTSSPKGSIKMV